MLHTLQVVSSGAKAALLAVGVGVGAGAAHVAPVHAPVPVHIPVPHTRQAILRQMDHRLGVIERTQKTMLRGYETGGIYR